MPKDHQPFKNCGDPPRPTLTQKMWRRPKAGCENLGGPDVGAPRALPGPQKTKSPNPLARKVAHCCEARKRPNRQTRSSKRTNIDPTSWRKQMLFDLGLGENRSHEQRHGSTRDMPETTRTRQKVNIRNGKAARHVEVSAPRTSVGRPSRTTA